MIWLKLLAYYAVVIVVLTGAAEVYARLSYRAAFLPPPFLRLCQPLTILLYVAYIALLFLSLFGLEIVLRSLEAYDIQYMAKLGLFVSWLPPGVFFVFRQYWAFRLPGSFDDEPPEH